MDSSKEVAGGLKFLSGTCPDPECLTKLYCLPSYPSVQCTGCGQQHESSSLLNMSEEKGDVYNTAMFAIKSIIAGVKPEPGTDNVKVHGLSNYKCKLLSHLLSTYGMDRVTWKARLLTDMGQSAVFDCGLLCDRAFSIDRDHLSIKGFGRDQTGGALHLDDTLNVIKQHNGNEERLVPIHADGDGHCLVHAVSRALVGRELFWHPLRLNLKRHLEESLEKYKEMFHNFVDVNEWPDIIAECDPYFLPRDGEGAGLRNIHIFGLANVLKRPIILLDNLKCIESSGDYCGVFLPALLSPDQCKNKEGVLNPPLCIAWSNAGHNHFIPLVGVKNMPCPVLPRYLLQIVWGVDNILLDQYIAFNDSSCIIGGPKILKENYIQRLVTAMEGVFLGKYGVHPSLVADVHQYIFRPKGFVGMTLEMVRDTTQSMVHDRLLLRCLRCGCLAGLGVEGKKLRHGGELYNLAISEVGQLRDDKLYTFKEYQISCRYDPVKDLLVPDIGMNACCFCRAEKKFRHVQGDGTVEYMEGDITLEPAGPKAKCTCGFKHFYNGRLYDNRPKLLPISLDYAGETISEVIPWWENESDSSKDSNVFEVADYIAQKYFPKDFAKPLQRKVVDIILSLTDTNSNDDNSNATLETDDSNKWNPEEASKIIMTGYQTQSVHKEELSKSEAERQVKKRITDHAPQQQAKKSLEKSVKQGASPGSKNATDKSPTKAAAAKEMVSPTNGSTLLEEKSSASSAKSVSDSSPAGTAARPSAPKLAPGEKKVRIVGPDGSTKTVTLTEDLNFSQLQQMVCREMDVPVEKQMLRLGFPPQRLHPPAPEDEAKVVPLNHGDRIIVERIDGIQHSANLMSHGRCLRGTVDSHMPDEDGLADTLSDRGGDPVDSSIKALVMVAQATGMDIWYLVQKQPHLFSVNGIFYLKARKEIPNFVNGKHIELPHLGGKVFVYNAEFDRLELCLGCPPRGLGHFEVEPDVERKAQRERQSGQRYPGLPPPPQSFYDDDVAFDDYDDQGYKRWLSQVDFTYETGTGSTPPSTSNSHNQGSVPKVFGGQGHSLRGSPKDAKMPQELPDMSGSIRDAAHRLQTFCNPSMAIPEEEPEKMDGVDDKLGSVVSQAAAPEKGQGESKLLRKGPGFSVLEAQSPPDQMEQTAEVLQRLKTALGDTSLVDSKGEEAAATEGSESMESLNNEGVSAAGEELADGEKSETMETTAPV